jgi:hypothetical protein
MDAPRCPECGSVVEIDEHAETESPVWKPNPGGMPYIENVIRPAIVAFCTGCEFAVELDSRENPRT